MASEKDLASRERQQLVALIGNVAHDLKTPLHSFKMEIESLRVALVDVLAQFRHTAGADATAVAPSTIATALARLGASKAPATPPLPTTIESLLKSLSASSEFMMMAINRGIEFAKASGGIRCGRSALPLSLSIIITYHSYHLTPRLCSLQ